MTIITNKPDDRREKIKKLREFHQNTLDSIDESNAIFIPKMAYKPIGKTEKHIGFFQNEMSKGDDIFLEFCSKENEPEDENRTLYKWKFNPHFMEEYDTTDPGPTGHVRHLVPIAELVTIKEYKVKEMADDFNLPDPDTDLPMDQMTIRDYAAIHMRKPVSRKDWLNDLVTK